MTDDRKLEVWTDGTDTVVCHGRYDIAAAVTWNRGTFESDVDDFDRIEDDKAIRINVSDDADDFKAGCDSEGRLTLTAAQWAAKNGRGLLCSTEY